MPSRKDIESNQEISRSSVLSLKNALIALGSLTIIGIVIFVTYRHFGPSGSTACSAIKQMPISNPVGTKLNNETPANVDNGNITAPSPQEIPELTVDTNVEAPHSLSTENDTQSQERSQASNNSCSNENVNANDSENGNGNEQEDVNENDGENDSENESQDNNEKDIILDSNSSESSVAEEKSQTENVTKNLNDDTLLNQRLTIQIDNIALLTPQNIVNLVKEVEISAQNQNKRIEKPKPKPVIQEVSHENDPNFKALEGFTFTFDSEEKDEFFNES